MFVPFTWSDVSDATESGEIDVGTASETVWNGGETGNGASGTETASASETGTVS